MVGRYALEFREIRTIKMRPETKTGLGSLVMLDQARMGVAEMGTGIGR